MSSEFTRVQTAVKVSCRVTLSLKYLNKIILAGRTWLCRPVGQHRQPHGYVGNAHWRRPSYVSCSDAVRVSSSAVATLPRWLVRTFVIGRWARAVPAFRNAARPGRHTVVVSIRPRSRFVFCPSFFLAVVCFVPVCSAPRSVSTPSVIFTHVRFPVRHHRWTATCTRRGYGLRRRRTFDRTRPFYGQNDRRPSSAILPGRVTPKRD